MRTLVLAGCLTAIAMLGCAATPAHLEAPPPDGDATSTTGLAAPVKPQVEAEIAKKPAEPAKEARDDKSSNDALWGQEIGDSFGSGGLGLSGVGQGGGGVGTGVGLGNVGTAGGGSGVGQGYGAAPNAAAGKDRPRGRVFGATATTAGTGLPAEVIARVVKQNVTQIRSCYDAAMAKDPALTGKISLSFTIGPTGAVTAATAQVTSIPDADMVTCVVSAVKRMTFPAPENGGTIVVTYPFGFAPTGS